MEVFVTDCDRLPENSIVSIRVGSTRRQAPLETVRSQPLKFPSALEACAEPLKIDVLQPVATARLVLHAHEERYRIGLDTKDKSLMALGLTVANCGETVPGQGAPTKLADGVGQFKFQDAAASAKEYLEQHGLLRYVQSLLHAVIQVRPKDPYCFMIEQLGAAQGVQQPAPATPKASEKPVAGAAATGQTPECALSPSPTTQRAAAPAATPAAPPAAPQLVSPASPQPTPPAPRPMEPVRPPGAPPASGRPMPIGVKPMVVGEAAAASPVAKAPAPPAEAAGPVKRPTSALMPPEQTRCRAASVPSVPPQPVLSADEMTAGSKTDAPLKPTGAALAAAKPQPEAGVVAKAATPALEVTEKTAVAPQADSTASPAATAAPGSAFWQPPAIFAPRHKALDQASKSPQAAAADSSSSAPKPSPASPFAGSGVGASQELEAARAMAAATLLEAHKAGTLEDALGGASQSTAEATGRLVRIDAPPEDGTEGEQDVHELRQLALETFSLALEDGRLESTMSGVLSLSPKAQARAKAAEKKRESQDVDELRQRALDTFCVALEDGRLEATMGEVLQAAQPQSSRAEEEAEHLRKHVRGLLEQRLMTGELAAAIQDVTKVDISAIAATAGGAAAAGGSGGGGGGGCGHGPHDCFMGLDPSHPRPAVSSSSTAAWQREEDDRQMREVRERMRRVLEDACENGRLQTVLRDCMPPGPASATAGGALGEEVKAETLKGTIRELLANAADSGELQQALIRARSEHLEPERELREKVRRLFEDSCENGALFQALEFCKAERRSGPPEATSTTASKEDEVRHLCKRLLEDACEAGHLEEILKGKPSQEEEVKRLCKRLFEDACESGHLEEVLKGKQPAQEQAATTAAPKSNAAPVVDVLRARTRDLLEQACQSGALESTLHRLSEEEGPAGAAPEGNEPLDQLKVRMRGLLENACETGQLAKELSTIAGSSVSSTAPPPPLSSQQATAGDADVAGGAVAAAPAPRTQSAPLSAATPSSHQAGAADAAAGGAQHTMAAPEQLQAAEPPPWLQQAGKLESLRQQLCQQFLTKATTGELDSIIREAVKPEPSSPLQGATAATQGDAQATAGQGRVEAELDASKPAGEEPPSQASPAEQGAEEANAGITAAELKQIYTAMNTMQQDNQTLYRQVNALTNAMEDLKKNNDDLVKRISRPTSARLDVSSSIRSGNDTEDHPPRSPARKVVEEWA
eukprot:TRINITY_DN4270_c0_g1_i2.p1 TRINITY_DN4270_c0_g1~~TRINITY_DN4270_c0_g1_i2.p1  ORF type:complete len:1214 (+),score=377.85 TRINITY_DN4270_c0_g1_i2:223-3864(+)